MNELYRPPLDPIIIEQIDLLLYRVDEEYWPKIAEFLVPRFIPPAIPVPPPRKLQFLQKLQEYAEALFKTEADDYETVRDDGRYPAWLSKLSERVFMRVRQGMNKVEEGNPQAILGFHGATSLDIDAALQKTLTGLVNQYTWRDAGPHPQDAPATSTTAPPKTQPTARQRMSATIHSPSAAKKMEAYMNAYGLDQTEFAIQANTTDKTIRKFRQTGKVKRSILDGIASAMGISKQELLR